MAVKPLGSQDEPELDVLFIDYAEPLAKAGTYTVRAEPVIEKDGSPIWEGEDDRLQPVEDTYEVHAARFYLDEASTQALYPARNMSGDFGLVLPHIALRQPTLPWGRSIRPQPAGTERGTASEAPWMALLVFMAEELPDNPAGEAVHRPVKELISPEEDNVAGPDLRLGANRVVDGMLDEGVSEESAASDCRTIDVPAQLFTAIAPTEEELHYLVHVRRVTPHGQVLGGGEKLAEGAFAVVAANRFPYLEGPYAAHLVSLEGHRNHLLPGGIAPGKDRVRLCSLKSWVFHHSLDDDLDVPGLLQNLAAPGGRAEPEPGEEPPDPETIENLALRLPPPPEPEDGSDPDTLQYVRERFRHGYVPVPHTLPSGELSFGWYRGPATPVTAPRIQEGPDRWPYPPGPSHGGPPTTADHALVHEPAHGIFDVSYSAAWTLGRTLALSDAEYAAGMVRARRELANLDATVLALSADPHRSLADPDAPPGTHALRELASPGFAQSLQQALKQPTAPQQPLPGPLPRPVPVTADEARTRRAEPRLTALVHSAADQHAAAYAAWIDRLAWLESVPFSYLVPHSQLLPPESLRMFRIDPDWVEALLAGAASIAVSTSQDADLALFLQQALARTRTNTVPAAGVLIHSGLVAAWPDDFDIIARQDGRRITELRRDRPADNILLCLFDQVPDELSIREPGQGIHFGLDIEGGKEVISLRRLTPDTGSGEEIGSSLQSWFPAPGSGDTVFTRYLRESPASPRRILNLRGASTFVADLARALAEADSIPRTDLAPGELALELVNSPIEQRLITRRQAE
ncbi:hypothetical protein [Streptomyces sp. x-19]|uniref:hypothetical protein n=1 Tax=Streptomyces sp. x-19 TaxID=2789280 RepID=UPI003980B05D